MGAVFSPCGRYRYRLSREFIVGDGSVLFIMLNPSTADAERDDPSVRRCLGFARRWGFKELLVGNLFAWRATMPRELRRANEPIGPDNDLHLAEMAWQANVIIAAWGTHGAYQGRDKEVARLLRKHWVEHLGLTAGGQPRHPLYLRNDAVRVNLK